MRQLLVLSLLLLASCGPQRIASDAPLPVRSIDGPEMDAIVQAPEGFTVCGVYVPDATGLGRIYLRNWWAASSTLPHEAAHAADATGKSYAEILRLMTPEHPSPEMASALRLCWEIQRANPTDPWQAIYDRWGADAVGHPHILQRLTKRTP